MIKIEQTVIVEGKYDKIKLESLISANIITTDGFRIYNDREKQALIRKIAQKTGIIILTDSDTAGRRIRGFIKNLTGGRGCLNIYLPEILGKEKRKGAPSKEGLIGVEGADKRLIREAFERFGVACSDAQCAPADRRGISRLDLYEDGLSGGPDSAKKRAELCRRLGLPRMSAGALAAALNILTDFGEYKQIVSEIRSDL